MLHHKSQLHQIHIRFCFVYLFPGIVPLAETKQQGFINSRSPVIKTNSYKVYLRDFASHVMDMNADSGFKFSEEYEVSYITSCRAGSEATDCVAWRLCVCVYVCMNVCMYVCTGMQTYVFILPMGVAFFPCTCSALCSRYKACTTIQSPAERWWQLWRLCAQYHSK